MNRHADATTGVPPGRLGLVDTAELMVGHIWIETRLFELTGEWSVQADPAVESSEAAGSGLAGSGSRSATSTAAVPGFFAAQSAFHAWRAQQWSTRIPGSVAPESDLAPSGWAEAVEVAVGLTGREQRLAAWSLALQPSLSARYRRHRSLAVAPADDGVRRWLDLALFDCGDGRDAGHCLLGELAADAASVADVTGAIYSELLRCP